MATVDHYVGMVSNHFRVTHNLYTFLNLWHTAANLKYSQ